MKVIAFNASPRKKGNTSALITAVLEGAESAGAETQEVRLHDLNMKGCQACYACKEKQPGVCALKDELSPFLHAMKDCTAVVLGSPIYMYRVAGQMKIFVDRIYSYYIHKKDGQRGYDSALPPGKNFAMVVSQGAPAGEQYQKSIRWLAGMAGTGLGMTETGRIVHTNSHDAPAKDDEALLAEARALGAKLVQNGAK